MGLDILSKKGTQMSESEMLELEMSTFSSKENDELSSYCNEFFGYGHPEAPVWFIGIEERDNLKPNPEAALKARINAWVSYGRGDIIDCWKYHKILDEEKGEPGSFYYNTPTWVGMREFYNGLGYGFIPPRLSNIPGSEDEKRSEVENWLSNRQHDVCSLELFPLPKTRTDSPLSGYYPDLKSDDERAVFSNPVTQTEYYRYVSSARVQILKELIIQRRKTLKSIVLYGNTEKGWLVETGEKKAFELLFGDSKYVETSFYYRKENNKSWSEEPKKRPHKVFFSYVEGVPCLLIPHPTSITGDTRNFAKALRQTFEF